MGQSGSQEGLGFIKRHLLLQSRLGSEGISESGLLAQCLGREAVSFPCSEGRPGGTAGGSGWPCGERTGWPLRSVPQWNPGTWSGRWAAEGGTSQGQVRSLFSPSRHSGGPGLMLHEDASKHPTMRCGKERERVLRGPKLYVDSRLYKIIKAGPCAMESKRIRQFLQQSMSWS